MLKKILILALILCFTLGNRLIAAGKDFNANKNPEWLSYSPLSELSNSYAYASAYNSGNSYMQQKSDTTQPFHYPLVKSPKKALFFSVLIPGMGEIYTKSYLQSAVFIGIEVALWLSYANFIDEGNKLEDKFKTFADEHWSRERYIGWLSTAEGQDASITHELPETKTQQYYEMIGKYNQFYYGWSDVDELGLKYLDVDGIRVDYMDMRGDSNEELKKATTMASLAILNHIASAADAAWCAFRYNKKDYEAKHKRTKRKKVKTSLRFKPLYRNNEIVPAMALNLRW